jgi:hypothetical protein
MVMNDDEEYVNNDKAYDDNTCDVHIDEACFDNDVDGYACKASADYEYGNDVVVDGSVHDDDDDDEPNDELRFFTCLNRLW